MKMYTNAILENHTIFLYLSHFCHIGHIRDVLSHHNKVIIVTVKFLICGKFTKAMWSHSQYKLEDRTYFYFNIIKLKANSESMRFFTIMSL